MMRAATMDIDIDASLPSLKKHGKLHALKRIRYVYQTYAGRSDPLAAARTALPGDCRVTGFVGAPDDPEISFWRPFDGRRVEDILAGDSPSQIRERHIQYAVVSDVFLHAHHQTIDDWLQANRAVLLRTLTVTTEVSVGPAAWHLVRLEP